MYMGVRVRVRVVTHTYHIELQEEPHMIDHHEPHMIDHLCVLCIVGQHYLGVCEMLCVPQELRLMLIAEGLLTLTLLLL